MKRKLYLVTYDICDPSRLQKTHSIVQAYAIGGQKSFYECWLAARDLRELVSALEKVIVSNEDSLLFFFLDPSKKPTFIGTAERKTFEPFIIG